MVLHPALAGSTVEDMYYNYHLNNLYAAQRRASTNTLANNVVALFQKDTQLTDCFNSMLDGKWNGMMDQKHIGYTSWDDPLENIMPAPLYLPQSQGSGSGIGVAVQGGAFSTNGSSLTTFAIDPYLAPEEARWLEIYALKNGTFPYTVSTNTSYATLSQCDGRLMSPGEAHVSDHRINIEID
ncbi:hypothetical protein LTR56_026539 [Elasticomyces elasticus]|nr:hypothetical protein LTR56_026539 [Elasticomyces elasticus]KAK3616276.1 hypothetical protein LTR22_027125 [Elasticomyces elasticus]KAK4889598.1 hypothetical protein LTR49_028779 [Elasticomyces elasticus]KAK5682080.1 hypothetical protein LTS12_029216 [Elasticomyces elasticus]